MITAASSSEIREMRERWTGAIEGQALLMAIEGVGKIVTLQDYDADNGRF